MNAYTNYYELLQVPQEAVNQQIKKAFMQLIRENHPDKQGGSR
jgi:DnaJ-class molecular chaperone